MGDNGPGSTGSVWGPVAGSFECDNETSDSIKWGIC